mmetsp:Transcript_14609/g.29240  ORF Transcript_14609/g.29240 Transcript_14609/m.29240 type:complete len:205 (-) Transcript_14609:1516-2130(-)
MEKALTNARARSRTLSSCFNSLPCPLIASWLRVFSSFASRSFLSFSRFADAFFTAAGPPVDTAFFNGAGAASLLSTASSIACNCENPELPPSPLAANPIPFACCRCPPMIKAASRVSEASSACASSVAALSFTISFASDSTALGIGSSSFAPVSSAPAACASSCSVPCPLPPTPPPACTYRERIAVFSASASACRWLLSPSAIS